ncbi:hypothetical protein C8R45DRAFT_1164800 [Mycena sanguinolenta]|nr:hypothetical protein C8R45DRAFT_1164800 [Mycena sanguinolenta]
MQSPLLHQVSSIRDSLLHEDGSPMNYHTLPGQTVSSRPRAPHSALPLSSLASSSGGGNILASTILDISAPNSSSSLGDRDQAQPQSKSEQDLAHYLATSNPNPTQSQALNREQTLLHTTSLSGEWSSDSTHSLGGIFDRGSSGLMGMALSWGDMNAAIASPNPSPSAPAAASSSFSPPETTSTILKPYNPRGEYFLASSAAGESEADIWSLTHSESTDAADSDAGPLAYHVPTVTERPSPSLSSVPLSLPIPSSLLRVNVNTSPRVSISPHMRAGSALPRAGAGVSPIALRSQASSPFPDLAYPEDAEPQSEADLYVNLADLVHTSDDVSELRTSAASKRCAEEEGVERSGDTKRLCLRDVGGLVKPARSTVSGSSAGSHNEDEVQDADDDQEAASDEGIESQESESDSDFDADDSGEFVLGRSTSRTTTSRPRRSKRAHRAGEGEVRVSAKQRQRQRQRSDGAKRPRRVHTGSAAAALRVITQRAQADAAEGKDSPASTSTSATTSAGLVSSALDALPAVKPEAEYPDPHPYQPHSHSQAQAQAPALLPFPPSFPSSPYAGAAAGAGIQAPYTVPTFGHAHPRPHPYPPHPHPAYPAPSPLSSSPYASPSPFYDPAHPNAHVRGVHKGAVAGPLPAPVPVPNLIKKSRGRHVPPVAPTTIAAAGAGADAAQERGYVCTVEGCGKGFVRGEHLKRHVRSIHTYEKPFVCPHAGCGKAFSRRDNLAQHARVHLA